MNLILLDAESFVSKTRVRLTGRRLEHVRHVHRAEPGDRLRVGEINGRTGTGTVLGTGPSGLELEVALTDEPPAKLSVTLGVALPRPPSLRKILQAGTALGVERFVFYASARVEKSYWQSSSLRPAALEHELRLGLEQARDTRLPEVRLERSFHGLLETSLPALCGERPIWFAHPVAAEPCPRGTAEPAALLLGPEGGFTDPEVERLVAAGARGVTLGERRLRVEHAVVALLARIF